MFLPLSPARLVAVSGQWATIGVESLSLLNDILGEGDRSAAVEFLLPITWVQHTQAPRRSSAYHAHLSGPESQAALLF